MSTPATSVTVRTPAKINLCLGVGTPRDDGFHPVATVFQAVGLFDDVRARIDEPGRFSVRVHGDDAHLVPDDDTNLALRAAQLLAQEYGVEQGVALHVHKTIPVAGGMAGGSSDAAAALVACSTLWDIEPARDDLLRLAAQLGSDVPFCLVGGTAIGSGRGEQVSPVLGRGRFEWVIAIAEGGLPSPEVYAEVDRLRADEVVPEPAVPTELMAALRDGCPQALGNALANDLQRAALSLRPDLAAALDAGDQAGALGAMVSGSGPTTVFLAADEQHVDELAGALLAAGVCRRVLHAAGPVPGARVVG
ncbi:MAG: 4-(cytidine 5'-diphospho)-2-C-methyl-D-erythritol kinase [Propionibacteriales bacterium]|nr:4-(cytidine 5'-diphospho)-2-C-methyl-D-erythritol kinase [Propionibacteriales bacterium]